MAYTYEQLHAMTVAQLREIAQGTAHEAVKGASTMHKEKRSLQRFYALN